jgi:hypothetical protein
MPIALGEDTFTAPDNNENTVFTSTANKHFMTTIDLSNMASGDTVILRAKTIVKSAGSFVTVYSETFTGAQTFPNFYIPPISGRYGYRLTLQQTAGTLRTFDWRVDEP